MWDRLRPFLLVLRPLNVLIAAGSVCVVVVIVTTSLDSTILTQMVLAALSAALICAAGNVINDFYDIEIDRLNKPSRPLASGEINPRAAVWYSVILFLAGNLAAAFINENCAYIAAFTSVGLYGYSAFLKRTTLLGNLAVSFFAGLTFVFGGVAVGAVKAAIIPAVFAFLFHLGREIIKDLEDYRGDKARDARTLPIRFGPRSSLVASTVVFGVLVVVTLVPYLVDVYGLLYLIVVVTGVDLYLLFAIVSMWHDSTPLNLSRISLGLKLDMVVGLFAIYLG